MPNPTFNGQSEPWFRHQVSQNSPSPASSETQVPKSLEELEALLQMARNQMSAPADEAELEPGDLQYLRGTSRTLEAPSTLPENWLLPDIAKKTAAESGSETVQAAQAIPGVPAGTAIVHGLTLGDLGDVDLDITIELGRSELLIEDVLKLREGSVVSLDKRAGDPVDILANGRLIGRGELLVVDGKFGVRLSEVL